MLKVEVLAVGRELLIGKTVNTNAYWIGGRLARMGGRLSRVTVVDDDLGEIASSVKEALERAADFLIVVGGLGPTPDDLTLQGIAQGLGKRLELDRPALKMVREHYAGIGRGEIRLTPSRRKMARLPQGATPLLNKVGTAPGVRLESGKTVIFSLPGVPREMKSIFRESLRKEIRARMGKLYSRTVILNLEGIFESTLAPIIKETMRRHPSAYIKSHPKGVEEGISRVELDIGVVSRKREDVRRSSAQIASELERRVIEASGTIRSRKEHDR